MTITGFVAISLQPNSWCAGEYAGLMVIRDYHEARGQGAPAILCLIPASAHGTNPASAVMAGMEVVVTKMRLKMAISILMISGKKQIQHKDNLAALDGYLSINSWSF